MIVTALDLAARTGVCYGHPFTIPQTAVWNLSPKAGTPIGDRGLILMDKLCDHLDEVRPGLVVIEQPLAPHELPSDWKGRSNSNLETNINLNGYTFLALTLCRSRLVPAIMYHRQKVLRHFTGQPRYKIRNDGKRACVLRAKMIYRLEVSWDEADAVALWDYGCALNDPRGFALAGVVRPVAISKGTL